MPEPRSRRVPTATQWGTYDAVVVDGKVTALEPIASDPDPSPIADGMVSALYDSTRIVEPMVRKGFLEGPPGQPSGRRGADPFVAVSWERAFELAASELDRVRSAYGNAAIYGGSYGWASAGRFHHAQSQIHRFLAQIGGYTTSMGSYSVGAMEVILPHVIGGSRWSIWERGPLWSDIAAHGELVVSFGGLAAKNAQVNPGGVGRHAVPSWQRRCADAGVRFVTVSPLRDDAPPWLDAEWVSLRPNTDVALMCGLAHAIVGEGRHDRDFLERCCIGFDRFERYVFGEDDGVPKDPAWAAAITGVSESRIVDLARDIATRRTVINVSWSIQRQDHGEQAHWAAVALAALSGSMGRPGGGFAAGLGITSIGLRPGRAPVASLPQGSNAVDSFIPVSRIADMLLGPGERFEYNGKTYTYPDVRVVYWAGGNPFHHHQDLNRLVRAWQRPETVIVHDSWWNPLARHADIVFPVATTLERADFAVGMNEVSLTAMHRAVDPPRGVLTDYEVFAALADRLGVHAEFTEDRSTSEWVRELYDRTRADLAPHGIELPAFEVFWARGRVDVPAPPMAVQGRFDALREDPEAHPLDTPSGRIELYSATIAGFGYDDCPGHPTWMEPVEWLGAPGASAHPLHLVGSQPAARLHSQYDNGSHSRANKVAGREPVLISSRDARARGIADGDVVRIFNARGACLAGARVVDDLHHGVVVLATGAWYDPVDPLVDGSLEAHGNPNVLTADRGTSRLAQAPAPGSTLVEVERFEGEAPPVRAFEPPEIETV
jgi:biotin/methionine sulfoxide reductase